MENESVDSEFDFSSTYTDNFPAILAGLKISLAVTSYQSKKFFFIRSDGDEISTNFKSFPRPMGLAIDKDQITLGTWSEVLKFNRHDSVISKLDDKEKVDACYMPQAKHVTGMINIHDIAYGKDGLWVTNSAFSCLSMLTSGYNFVPKWKPPFISELKPEDRCHLNGMAMRDGKPRYVTTFSKFDSAKSWKESKTFDGTIIDINTDEILLDGLIMPHSPRYHNDKIYFCESGKGLVCSLDPQTKVVETIAKLEGFTRGMSFYGPLLFVGLSKVRVSDIRRRIPLTEELDETKSGIWIVNLEDNSVIGNIDFKGDVDQIYDVGVIEDVTYPELIEFNNELVRNSFKFTEL